MQVYPITPRPPSATGAHVTQQRDSYVKNPNFFVVLNLKIERRLRCRIALMKKVNPNCARYCATQVNSKPRLNEGVFWNNVVKVMLCDAVNHLSEFPRGRRMIHFYTLLSDNGTRICRRKCKKYLMPFTLTGRGLNQ